MDLIQAFAAKRLELAGKIDRKELTEDRANIEGTRLSGSIVEAGGRRETFRSRVG
jgi:hypothetical protein